MSTETDHTNYDEKAWQKLESNRESWNGYDEEEETIWPCNRNEIRKTAKVLKSIDYQKLTGQEVIDEYDLQNNLIKAFKKDLPNNRLKMLMPLIILSAVMIFFFWYAYPPNTISYNQNDWVVHISSEFASSSAHDPQLDLQLKTIKPGTKVEPLAIGQQKRAKVKLPSGEIGYMHLAAFSGIKTNSEIIKGTQLFKSSNNKKEIAKLDTIMPRVKSIQSIKAENNHYLKVKSSKGRVGYIFDNHIKYHFSDSLPNINREYVLPVASTKARKWKGQSVSEIEAQYSPASAIFGNKSYWEYIRVIGDTTAYRGVIAYISDEGIIDSIQFGKQEKLFASTDILPIWRMIASWEPFYGSVNMYYEQNDRDLNIGWWENLRSSHWSVKFITWIIELILKLFWFFIKISFLFLPIMAIGVIVSHLERPSYRLSVNLVIWLLVFVYIYFIIFSLLQNSIEIIGVIILFIAALVNLFGFFNHLNRKCYNCGNWDGEITEKTDFMGQSISVEHGSKNKYMGSDTKFTGSSMDTSTNTKTNHYTTTNYYKKVKTKDTYQYDNFKDHKMCKYCGRRWKENYQILKGERHEEY